MQGTSIGPRARHAGSERGRRDVLAGCARALGAATAALTLGAAADPTASLAAVAESRGLRYGATVSGELLASLPAYAALVVGQCALLAPVLDWDVISPREDELRVDTDVGVVRFARSHGLPLTGWHLLWHLALPKWFARLPDAATARRAIETHITRMGATYAEGTWSVNVVNEALNPRDGSADGLRRSALSAHLGSDYIDIAFHAARRAFPDAQLLLNDYGMEQEGPEMQQRREALLGVLDRARKAGTPIDGVGLQAHLTLQSAFDAAGFTGFLRQIASRGFSIVITELDVLDVAAPAAFAIRDREVASLYGRFLDATLKEPEVAAVITWGLSDRDTWLTPEFNFVRFDRLPIRPLPFDRDLRPKPAYFAIRDCLSHASLRQLARLPNGRSTD